MDVTYSLCLLKAGARAALVVMALVGAASLATRLAFTTSSIQARVDEIVHRAPSLVTGDDQAETATVSRLSSHQL